MCMEEKKIFKLLDTFIALFQTDERNEKIESLHLVLGNLKLHALSDIRQTEGSKLYLMGLSIISGMLPR